MNDGDERCGGNPVERLVPIYGDLPGDDWTVPVCAEHLADHLADHLLGEPLARGPRLTGIDGGHIDPPEPPACVEDHCHVVVLEEGDRCEACELAWHDSRDYARSLEAPGGDDW